MTRPDWTFDCWALVCVVGVFLILTLVPAVLGR